VFVFLSIPFLFCVPQGLWKLASYEVAGKSANTLRPEGTPELSGIFHRPLRDEIYFAQRPSHFVAG